MLKKAAKGCDVKYLTIRSEYRRKIGATSLFLSPNSSDAEYEAPMRRPSTLLHQHEPRIPSSRPLYPDGLALPY